MSIGLFIALFALTVTLIALLAVYIGSRCEK